MSSIFRTVAAAAVLVCAIIPMVSAEMFYFHVNQGEDKCFIEELPEGVTLVVKYETHKFDKQLNNFVPTDTGVHIHIEDPMGGGSMDKDYSVGVGKVYFTTTNFGEHIVCISADTRKWIGGHQMRIYLELDVRDTASESDSTEVVVEGLERMLRDSIHQASSISKEQKYQKGREEIFRDLSESTNYHVLWWAVVQSMVLLLMGAWQITHLKNFFKAKKIM